MVEMVRFTLCVFYNKNGVDVKRKLNTDDVAQQDGIWMPRLETLSLPHPVVTGSLHADESPSFNNPKFIFNFSFLGKIMF